jgi:maltose-binding protein MalE
MGLAGISSLDTLYQRGDIHPTLLDTVSYAGELAAVPLDGSQLLLYVRKDVLAAAATTTGAAGGGSSGSSSGSGLGVPDSWEQLLVVAAAVNGSAAAQLRPMVNATGGVSYAAATGPVFGFCMQPHTHMLGSLVLAVLAPLVQINGSEQVGSLGTGTSTGWISRG